MSYNKKAIADALSKLNKARKPKQVNDIIMDPEGQNKFPGLPTRIPSDNITMETTPHPVLGVDNFGNQQMMYPGANYTFPGADYVDEYPMAQYGGLVTGLTNTKGNLLMNSKGKRMMAKSGSLYATNKLFLGNPLVTKRKKAVFVPGHDFQTGGQKPTVYVDPNDPAGRFRYNAYQDSLRLWNQGQKNNAERLRDFGTNKWGDKVVHTTYSSPKEMKIHGFYENDAKVPGLVNKPTRYEESKLKSKYASQASQKNGLGHYTGMAHGIYAEPKQPIQFQKTFQQLKQPVEYKPNPEVVAKQQQLIDAGYKIGKADGIWGPKSQTAWEEFQKAQATEPEVTPEIVPEIVPEETTSTEESLQEPVQTDQPQAPQQPSGTPKSSEPKPKYHKEFNPYTKRWEPMSPKQKQELDRLNTRGLPAPQDFTPELIEAHVRQSGGATDWRTRIASTLNYQQGGQLSAEEFAKRKAAYEKVTGSKLPQKTETTPIQEPIQQQPVVNNTTVRPSTGYTGFRDEGALMYNPVEITAKDKWGRQSGQSAWFGFDPEKNEFTTADRWGRKPGDPQYGYDSERDIWTMGSKGSKKVSIKNPYIFDDKDIENPKIQKQADECLIDPVTGKSTCLGSSFRYYDKYVAPNLGIPNSWQIKEKAGLSSGKTHSKFKDVGESWDSWELAGGLKDAGAKVFYTGGREGKGWNPNENEWRNLKLPIGTIVNWGDGGRNNNNNQETYNEKKGLAPSNHSTIIVGYDKTGLPIMQDYGKIKKVTDPSFPGVGVTNIIAPKEVLDKTYDKLKTDKLATGKTEYKPLSKKKLRENIDKLAYLDKNALTASYKDGKAYLQSHTNIPVMTNFVDLLSDKKEKYMTVFGIDNDTYDEYARRALAIAFVETRGADPTVLRNGVPAYQAKQAGYGTSHGVTQIKHEENIWNNPTLSKKMNKLGITKENYDPYKTEHIVPATILMIKNTDRTAQINLKKYPGNNLEMHPAMVNYYQWNRPGTFVRGEAGGNAIAAKRFMNYYNNIELQKGGQLSSEEFEKRKAAYERLTGKKFTSRDIDKIKQQQNLQKFIDNKKPLEKKLPTSEAEAMTMIKSGELKIETIAETKARNNNTNDSLLENIVEFFDPTGILSHDDAERAYYEWKKSGNTFPSFGQTADMFGAIPMLGKFGKLKYLTSAPNAMKVVYKYFPWQQAINAVDAGEDLTTDNFQQGGATNISLPAFQDMELTDEEIEKYKRGGCTIVKL